jgi:hypothetical protein
MRGCHEQNGRPAWSMGFEIVVLSKTLPSVHVGNRLLDTYGDSGGFAYGRPLDAAD